MLMLALLVSCGCVLIEATPVSTGAADSVLAESVPAGLVGRWLAEDINGGGVIDDLQTTLEINDDGTYAGFAGCNSYTGTFNLKSGKIIFGSAGVTRNSCVPAVMNQEMKFFNVFKTDLLFQVTDGKLVLTASKSQTALRLSRAEGGMAEQAPSKPN